MLTKSRARCHARVRICLVIALALLFVAPVQGADGKRITVIGIGVANVRPDVLEIHGIVVGQAELASEANSD